MNLIGQVCHIYRIIVLNKYSEPIRPSKKKKLTCDLCDGDIGQHGDK